MSKKKLIITITSLCLVIIAAVAAVVGVVAASTQTVTSTITVNYKATNVKAEVSYAKRLASTTYGSDAGTVTFDATEATRTTSNSIAVPAITLGNSAAQNGWSFERYAIVRFAFHNLYASGQGRTLNVATTASVTAYNTASGKNYAIAFAKGTTEPAVPTTLTGLSGDDSLAETWLSENTSWSATPSFASLSVAQAGTSYIFVLVAMINPLLDASLSSQSITFTLTSPTT